MQFSCVIIAKNEAHRIGPVIEAACLWADDVLVALKPSNDGTGALAVSLGARVVHLADTPQGGEDLADVVAGAHHDWVLILTSGEIPTPGLVGVIRSFPDSRLDQLDGVYLPLKYWSFGVHSSGSPWSWSNQLRLVNRRRATFTNKVHDAIKVAPNRGAMVDAKHKEQCHLLHQTHPDVPSFVRSHLEYMQLEAAAGAPERLANARQMLAMGDRPDMPEIQRAAWNFYWHGVVLHCLGQINQTDSKPAYWTRMGEYLNNLRKQISNE